MDRFTGIHSHSKVEDIMLNRKHRIEEHSSKAVNLPKYYQRPPSSNEPFKNLNRQYVPDQNFFRDLWSTGNKNFHNSSPIQQVVWDTSSYKSDNQSLYDEMIPNMDQVMKQKMVNNYFDPNDLSYMLNVHDFYSPFHQQGVPFSVNRYMNMIPDLFTYGSNPNLNENVQTITQEYNKCQNVNNLGFFPMAYAPPYHIYDAIQNYKNELTNQNYLQKDNNNNLNYSCDDSFNSSRNFLKSEYTLKNDSVMGYRGNTPNSDKDNLVNARNGEIFTPANEIYSLYYEPSRELYGVSRVKRQRMTYTRNQINILEKEFSICKFLHKERRSKLAEIVGLSERQVKIWFQNRRMKKKKEKRPGDRLSDFDEKPSSDTIF